MSTVYYPVKIRSTGTGWALGLGRAGTVVGPLWVGGMLTANWNLENLFLVVAIPQLVAMVGLWLLASRYPELSAKGGKGLG